MMALRRPSRDRALSLAVIAPSIVVVAVFVYGLIGWTGFISTTNWNQIATDYSSAGLANYRAIFGSTRFQLDLRNTVVFTGFFVSTSLVVGLSLANLIDRRIRGEGLFRSVFLFPM